MSRTPHAACYPVSPGGVAQITHPLGWLWVKHTHTDTHIFQCHVTEGHLTVFVCAGRDSRCIPSQEASHLLRSPWTPPCQGLWWWLKAVRTEYEKTKKCLYIWRVKVVIFWKWSWRFWRWNVILYIKYKVSVLNLKVRDRRKIMRLLEKTFKDLRFKNSDLSWNISFINVFYSLNRISFSKHTPKHLLSLIFIS